MESLLCFFGIWLVGGLDGECCLGEGDWWWLLVVRGWVWGWDGGDVPFCREIEGRSWSDVKVS